MEQIEYLRSHFELEAFGPFCDGTGNFIMVIGLLTSEAISRVIQRFPEAINHVVDSGQLLVLSLAVSLMTINRQFAVHPVSYFTVSGMSLVRLTISFSDSVSKQDLCLCLDDLDKLECCLTSLPSLLL